MDPNEAIYNVVVAVFAWSVAARNGLVLAVVLVLVADGMLKTEALRAFRVVGG